MQRMCLLLACTLLFAIALPGCKLFSITHPPRLSAGGGPNILVSPKPEAPGAAVDMYFDQKGIPHIFAETEVDAAYALGFAHARDRLFQMDVMRHAATGRLTEIFGESLIEVDRQLRLATLRSRASLDALSPRDRGIVDAYVIGVNQGADYAGKGAAEFVISGRNFQPFTALDVIHIRRLKAWELSHNLLAELARARIQNRLPASDPRAIALMRPVPTGGVAVLKRDDPLLTAPPASDHANDSRGDSQDDDDKRVAPEIIQGKGVDRHVNDDDDAPSKSGDTTDDTNEQDNSASEDAAKEGAASGTREEAAKEGPSAFNRLQWFFAPGDVEERKKIASWTKDDNDWTARFSHPFGVSAGSNAWVVSGAQTASGYPILVADPHLRHTSPSLAYLAHIEVREKGGGKAVGMTSPGVPAIFMGHTDHLAWALVTSFADTQDLVRITPDPSERGKYIVDGKKLNFGTLTQSYVESGQTIMTETWRTTIFGPVLPGGYEHLKEPGEDYAVLWTGFNPKLNATNFSGYWDLLYAKSPVEAFAAVDKVGAPSQNVLFAFTDGSIAYRLMGALPKRQSGAPGDRPRDGSTSSSNWRGVLANDKKPSALNPPWGILVAANQRITDDNDPLVSFVGRAAAAPYRAERIAERLQDVLAKGPATADALLDIQQDVHSIEARLLAPAFAKVCPRSLEGIPNYVVIDFCNALASFDGEYLRGSSGALVFTWLLEALQQEVLTVHLGDDVARQLAQDPATVMALAHAFLEEAAGRPSPLLDDLRTPGREGLAGFVNRASRTAIYRILDALGEDAQEWRWGRVHVLQVDGFYAEAPLVGAFFFGQSTEQDGHSRTIRAEAGTPVRRGSILRMFAEMRNTRAGPNVGMVLDLGQSGHVDQDNARDQFPDWNAGITLPIETNKRKLEKKSGHLRMVPAP